MFTAPHVPQSQLDFKCPLSAISGQCSDLLGGTFADYDIVANKDFVERVVLTPFINLFEFDRKLFSK